MKTAPLPPRECENLLARHYSNSAPQIIVMCRRELARTCRTVRVYEGSEKSRSVYAALRRYVWLPFERLSDESCRNRAAATRRRIRRTKATA